MKNHLQNSPLTQSGDQGGPRRCFSRVSAGLALIWSLMLSACIGPSTEVENTWSAPGSGAYSMGRTVVIVRTRTPQVSDMVESIIARQLQQQELPAVAWHTVAPGVHGPDRTQVVPVVNSGGFNSVLTVNVLNVKLVERDYPATQVARAEVKLFSVSTENLVWSMVADTYVRTIAAREYILPREEDVQKFAETVADELIRAGIL